MKYVKVVDGTISNANGYEYKIGEINIAPDWNPKAINPENFGGFNYSREDKILRWLHRGDTIYDVEVPLDAETVEICSPSCPNGVFRSNKIIIKNPKPITDDIAIELYKKSDLPEETYYKCIVVLLFRNHIKAIKYIINDRINKNNVEAAIKEFETYISKTVFNNDKFEYEKLWDEAKEVYDILKEMSR